MALAEALGVTQSAVSQRIVAQVAIYRWAVNLRNGVSQIKKPVKYRDAIFEIPVVVARKLYFQTVCFTGKLTQATA
jgi:predicted transcriptional regulator